MDDGHSGTIERNSISSAGEPQDGEGLKQTEIQQAEIKIVHENHLSYQNVRDFKCDRSMGGMSFGEAANPFTGSDQ